MDPQAAADLPLRQSLAPAHPSDLCPPLHADHPLLLSDRSIRRGSAASRTASESATGGLASTGAVGPCSVGAGRRRMLPASPRCAACEPRRSAFRSGVRSLSHVLDRPPTHQKKHFAPRLPSRPLDWAGGSHERAQMELTRRQLRARPRGSAPVGPRGLGVRGGRRSSRSRNRSRTHRG
jgi:hypothetical protein